MKYLKLCIIFILCLGLVPRVDAARPKRDIVAERMRQHAQKPHSAPNKKPSKPKKKPSKPKPSEPPKEEKKEEKKDDKKDDKKKDDKKKDDKDEEKSGGGGGKSGGGKESKADSLGKEDDKKKDEKGKGEGKAGQKGAEQKAAPRGYFLPPPVEQPKALSPEQDQAIDALVQNGNLKSALQTYKDSHATLKVRDVNGIEHLESEGLTKGAAGVQLMHYLETKKDGKPFKIAADPETERYLTHFMQENCSNLWVTNEGHGVEVSYKGNTMAQAGKNQGSQPQAALEQLICMRVLDGKRVHIQFRVVAGEENKPLIQAYFRDQADAERLAAYIGGEVKPDAKSNTFYVALEEGASTRLLPSEGGIRTYYAKAADSIARHQV